MPFQSSRDNILTFKREVMKEKGQEARKQPLHPLVRRRRKIWLGMMVVIFCWCIVELIVQQNRIWDKEEELAAKQRELAGVQQKTAKLNAEIKKLHRKDYLLELAHKMGYSKPGEQNYSLPGKE
ncbi:FtsB family cell division protein [Laceyella putida]|uniref:Septum formation initiator family protein n=1 Tax=Laceyella putida TaxID=110101 RepID=A0ABW2RQL6_9BACL